MQVARFGEVVKFGAAFDMDGVLANTGLLQDKAWLQVANRNKAGRWTIADLHRIASRTSSTVALAQALFPEAAETDEIVAEKNRLYEASLRQTLLVAPDSLKIPGACELVGQLAEESVSLALNTSSPANQTELILETFGILRYFSLVLTAEDVQNHKPDPEGYLLVAKKWDLSPRHCVGFEDSLPGLTSLNSAGYGVIVAVGSTLSKAKVRASGLRIDRYIPNFSAFTLNELSGLFLSSRSSRL
jgi:sugar-phosphatase